MVSLAKAQRKASSYAKDVDLSDLYDQVDTLRDYVSELSSGFGKTANRELRRARSYAADAAHDAEGVVKDNVAASLVVALGLGIVVGWLLRR
jgi:ElaB/YqjD/DUF883 family membrane-anchored ribosome-binding protein